MPWKVVRLARLALFESLFGLPNAGSMLVKQKKPTNSSRIGLPLKITLQTTVYNDDKLLFIGPFNLLLDAKGIHIACNRRHALNRQTHPVAGH